MLRFERYIFRYALYVMPLGGIVVMCMRVFKTRNFRRWQRKTELSDGMLYKAVEEMAKGLVDADIGGGVVKKRIGLPGRGKRGSARTLVVTNRNDLWFFVFGFAKNERSNINSKELAGLREIAVDLLARSNRELDDAVANRALQEIHDDHKE